jgi:hypothetical protein
MPINTFDLVGNPKAIKDIRTWLIDHEGGKRKPLLVSGPPGCGKTTGITTLLEKAGYAVQNWNASDTRTEMGLQDVEDYLTQRGQLVFGESASQRYSKRAAILDECDGLYVGEGSTVIPFLKRMMEKVRKPMVLICNDRYSKAVRGLSPICHCVAFYPLRKMDVIARLLHIAKKEGVQVPYDKLDKIASAACGDLRSAINNFQFLVNDKSGNVTDTACDRGGTMSVSLWDRFRNVTNQNRPIVQRADLYEICPDLLVDFATENYPREAFNILTGKVDLEAMADAADALSESDLISESSAVYPYASILTVAKRLGGFNGRDIAFPAHVKEWKARETERKLWQSLMHKFNSDHDPSFMRLLQDKCRQMKDIYVMRDFLRQYRVTLDESELILGPDMRQKLSCVW